MNIQQYELRVIVLSYIYFDNNKKFTNYVAQWLELKKKKQTNTQTNEWNLVNK